VPVLAERGLLADTTPVAEYWPEFAAHGKQTLTVAHVLAHTAGVPQAPTGTTLAAPTDWEGMCARIADLPLVWEPGIATGYHALTFGYILGEVAHRITGRPIAQILAEDVAEPLSVADGLLYGVPATSLPRVALLVDGNWPAALAARADDSLFFRAAPAPCSPPRCSATSPST
jgi:CubicO group peptidase (beta-lactamase class C family)